MSGRGPLINATAADEARWRDQQAKRNRDAEAQFADRVRNLPTSRYLTERDETDVVRAPTEDDIRRDETARAFFCLPPNVEVPYQFRRVIADLEAAQTAESAGVNPLEVRVARARIERIYSQISQMMERPQRYDPLDDPLARPLYSSFSDKPLMARAVYGAPSAPEPDPEPEKPRRRELDLEPAGEIASPKVVARKIEL